MVDHDYGKQQAALQNASAQLQQAEKQAFGGIFGWITRLFMGKKFTNDMKGVMAQGQVSIAQAQVHIAHAQAQQQAFGQGVSGFNPYAQPGMPQAYGGVGAMGMAVGQAGMPAGNDPAMQPIQGISLERYAELGAAVSDLNNDPARIAQAIQAEGTSLADWEAAKTGWTARMQDMSLMGRVATAYMPLYQAALAKRKGGAASMSYEDYVAVSAAIKVFGFEAAMQATGVSQSDWTECAGQWNNAMAREMQKFANHHGFVGQEEQRLRAGGQPKRPTITRGGAAAGSSGASPSPGLAAGAPCRVAWSDGKQYPGRVVQVAPGQILVALEGGSQQWMPVEHVTPA